MERPVGHVIPACNEPLAAAETAAVSHGRNNQDTVRAEGGRPIVQSAASRADLLATIDKHYQELDLAFCKPLRDLRRAICGGGEKEAVAPFGGTPSQLNSTPLDPSPPHIESTAQPANRREQRTKPAAGEPRNVTAGSSRVKPGRRKKTVDNLDCEQWMVAQAVKDPSVTSRTGRQWAALGPWTSSRTYERTGIYRNWRRLRLLQAEAVVEQVQAEVADRFGEIDELPGMRVSRSKSALGKQERYEPDDDHERAVKEFLADAEAEARSRE